VGPIPASRSLADEYGPAGIHVTHVTIDGSLLNPDVYERGGDVNKAAYIDPTAAAETCYHLVEQPDRARTFNSTSTRPNARPHGE
jgi:hypothetical protein